MDARRDGFNLALALTREPVRRADDYGRRVDTAMLTELLAKLPERPKQVFVCGSNPFVEAAADATIAAGGRFKSDPHRALWGLKQLSQRG